MPQKIYLKYNFIAYNESRASCIKGRLKVPSGNGSAVFIVYSVRTSPCRIERQYSCCRGSIALAAFRRARPLTIDTHSLLSNTPTHPPTHPIIPIPLVSSTHSHFPPPTLQKRPLPDRRKKRHDFVRDARPKVITGTFFTVMSDSMVTNCNIWSGKK